MSAADDFIKGLPIDQLAAQLGADPTHVQAAVHQVVPALLGGMAANAADPDRAASLADAVGQHSGELADSGDISRVDPAEGEKIAQHVFGDQQEQVVATLGGINPAAGGGNDLVKKLIPLLAPLVLSFVAKQVAGGGGAGGGGGALGQILSQVLSGATQGSGGSAKAGGGLPGGLGDLLGGLLGGGRKK